MGKNIFVLLMLVASLLGFAQAPAIQPITKSQYEFVPNKGQWHPLALYKASIPYGSLYLESASIVYDIVDKKDYHKLHQYKHDHQTLKATEIPKRHAVRMRFEGVKYAPRTELINVQPHYYNYFLGKKNTWASEVHPGSKVNYSNIYPGVDFEISGVKDIKYQWVIAQPTPNKVAQIKTIIEGASSIKIENGKLVIKTPVGILTDDEPFVYQEINGEIIQLNCKYVLQDSTVTYEMLSDFDPSYPLVIDPKLIFSTYSGTLGDNFGFTATYDSRANLYAGGIVDALQGAYPVTSGAYDTSWNQGVGRQPALLASDISISKYDSAGSNLLWATYLGGGDDDYPHSLVVDRNDDLFVYGTTYSADFPYTTGCFDSTHGGNTDIIVSKLSEDGTKLLGSTFIGSDDKDGLNQNSSLKYNYSDDFRGDIITDDDGNLFVASVTFSDNMPLANASQPTKGNGYDGYLFSLTGDCKSMLWGTYLGGNGAEALYSIKLDQHQNIYVGGGTTSSDLLATDSVLIDTFSGQTDGVIAVFNKLDFSPKRLTYWGTPEYDQIYFIDIDAENRIFATGQTEGNLKKSLDAYGESGKGQFVFRIDTLLREIDLQTTFGVADGKPNLTPSAFLVDLCDHIYFSGWGSSVDPDNHPGTTAGLEVSSDAVQKTTDSSDFYIIVLGRNAETLLYATYFGGNITADHVDGGTSRFDKKGVVYQSVCASCDIGVTPDGSGKISDFPITPGAAFEINSSVSCSNASFKLDLQIRSAVIADFVATPTVGCGPLFVEFTNKSILGGEFKWDFGDGNTSDVINPTHTFTDPGLYVVTLTVIDSTTCNVSSIYQRQILVLSQSDAQFDVSFNGCDNKLEIENKSTNGVDYNWDFGDGNTSENKDPKHDYEDPGTYDITLLVNEGSLCESEITKSVEISEKITTEITLYNVFTPNNDPFNDCFIFDGAFLECKDYRLKIYNRWGELNFESTSPTECWNGRIQGTSTAVAEGTYFYVLQLSKNGQPISGIIDVIY